MCNGFTGYNGNCTGFNGNCNGACWSLLVIGHLLLVACQQSLSVITLVGLREVISQLFLNTDQLQM